MEGLFDPIQFQFPQQADKNNILMSIVKVRPLRTLEYAFFDSEAEADKFSNTLLDSNGYETIQYAITEADKAKCLNPEYSKALFTFEYCGLVKKGVSLPIKTPLIGHGNGVLISNNGYIATNFHLVSGAVEHLKKLEGYFGSENILIKNVEIEYPVHLADNKIIYNNASEVFFAGTYSKSDAYGNRLDLALLKINQHTPNFLKVSKDHPQKFDRIYSIGFSMRTERREEKMKLLGYENANYDLRVSCGLITQINDENSFLADTDGAPGNSGSAAINENGELVGIYCGSTGNGIVDPIKSLRRYVHASKLGALLKSKL